MINNISEKLKKLGSILHAVAIVSLIMGVAPLVISIFGEPDALPAAILLEVGGVCSFVGSLFTYGFGELIEKTTEIAENTAKNKNSSTNVHEEEYYIK